MTADVVPPPGRRHTPDDAHAALEAALTLLAPAAPAWLVRGAP